MTKFTL